jgi:hypothetical protein
MRAGAGVHTTARRHERGGGPATGAYAFRNSCGFPLKVKRSFHTLSPVNLPDEGSMGR